MLPLFKTKKKNQIHLLCRSYLREGNCKSGCEIGHCMLESMILRKQSPNSSTTPPTRVSNTKIEFGLLSKFLAGIKQQSNPLALQSFFINRNSKSVVFFLFFHILSLFAK